MLSSIHIRNFAIVTELEVNLHNGMTVLTGETGAGKSILIGALGMALGDRADDTVIRPGCPQAEINLACDLDTHPAVQAWLELRDLSSGGECRIRRLITREGRSRAYINGTPVTLQLLRELGEQLIDIHGQHEHHSLLRRDVQLRLLDEYAGHTVLVRETAQAFAGWHKLQQQWQEMQQSAADREARLALLRYQVEELEAVDLQTDEWQQLDNEHQYLSHADELRTACEQSLNELYDSESGALLARLEKRTADLRQYLAVDQSLDSTIGLLENAAIQVREAVAELRHHVDNLDHDPQRLGTVEQRLAVLHDLARKHHIAPELLFGHCQSLQQELANQSSQQTRASQLSNEVTAARKHLEQTVERLTSSRRQAAGQMEKQVSTNLQNLGMAGGRFAIAFEHLEPERYTATGGERLSFQVSAHGGQAMLPLHKVASGGELSRISLAIQVVAATREAIPTLVFDEVDVGIGGRVAEIVGQMLRSLGQRQQVLCITHLPTVAALGHHHLLASKTNRSGEISVSVRHLPEKERCNEIARMVGGIEITRQAREHAREMLMRAVQAD